MQYRQTPPIQYIPVFEAAARHLSFKKAAEELCVTAPAVGQQIKAFENWLQKPLFHRLTRHLSLTPEGEYYFQVAQGIMQAHLQGYTGYSRRFRRSALHVSAPIFVAQEVIMPNYLQFAEYAAGTELRLEARMSLVDFSVDPVDAAIRFGDGNWPELDCRKLCDATVTPVCSPAYADGHPLTSLDELYKHRLIYAEPYMLEWGRNFWREDRQHPIDSIVCDSYMAALKAAADGLGVALAILPTANLWINSGRLLNPFPQQLDTGKGYWLVTPRSEHRRPEIEALYHWLLSLFDKLQGTAG